MPRIKRSLAPPRRLTRPTRVESSESEDDEMRRFEVRPDDEWDVPDVPDSPDDLYGVSDDDDDDDTGRVERRGGVGLGSASNRGVGGPAGDEAGDASDQGSSGPRAAPQRDVLPSVEEPSKKTWNPLPSYDVSAPARRGIRKRSNTASSLSAGPSSSSPSSSPPPKRPRIESLERDSNEEDADPYPAAPLLGNSGSGVGPWTNPPGFEHPPLSAADSAQYPAVDAASSAFPAAHAVIDPSLAGSPTSTPADGVIDPSLAGSPSALSRTGSPFAPSLAGSDFAPNPSGPASGSPPAVDTAQSALASSASVDSNSGPSSASTESQPAIAQDSVSPSAAGSSTRRQRTRSTTASANNNTGANPASTVADPPLRRSTRPRNPASAPVEKAVEPVKAKKPVRAVPQRKIEIKADRLREGIGLEYNAFDLLYRRTDEEDATWTWETEDELWKTYRGEILNYWNNNREKRLRKMLGGKKNKSPYYLAKIYAHKIDKSAKVRHLADNDVRKQKYQWGWVGYKDLNWWTWDQLGDEHDEVRQHYLEKKAPDLVDYRPDAEDA